MDNSKLRVLFIILALILSMGILSTSTSASPINTHNIVITNQPNQDAWNVEFVGQIGGGSSPYAITINGNFAYMSVGNYIQILDITNPYLPLWGGRIHILPLGLEDLVASGNFLYVAAWNFGLKVIDVSDPANPIEIGSLDSPGSALGISISGIYAYLADGDYGLVIINISDPTQPFMVGSIDTPGTAYDVVVSGNYAYVVDDAKGLRVINISNPVNPYEVGFYDTPGGAVGLTVYGQYAYVADESAGLRIIRISNPSNPIEVGFFDPQYNVWDVAISGVYAYLANEYGGFKVVYIASPYYPYEIGSYDLNYVKHVAVSGEFAYVPDESSPFLWVFDISNPNNPIVAGQYDLSRVAYDVAISGEYAYIAYDSSGMGIINISSPSIPTETSIYDTSDVALGIAISGSYGYISDGADGLRAINISNPAAPFQVGFYDSPGYATDVVVSGNLAYLADGSYGLKVINISDPAHPYVIGSLSTPGYAIGLAISGTYIYIADSSAGLRIVNISNPYRPIEIGYYDSPGDANNIALSGNYAYLADGYSGIRVVDITNPANPNEVGYYDTPGLTRGIAISSGIAYVADGSSGLQLLSVINPTTPILVGYYEAGDYASNVTISGDYIYLANTYGGMFILRFTGDRYFSISGHIADSIGTPTAGVILSAGQGYSDITDSQGNYVINSVIAGRYTVTPRLIGYTFAPLFRTVHIPPDATGIDFTATLLQINRVEINQGLGRQYEDAQNYVAGKDTAIQVFLNAPVLINPENQQIVVKRNGDIVTTLSPQWQSQPTDTLSFLCNRTTCGNWQAGSYTFEATVNGVVAQKTAEFQSQETLRILAVAITVTDRGEIKSLPDDQWKTADGYLNTVYPIASDSVQWVYGYPLPASWLDLTTQSGRENLIRLLRLYLLLQPGQCDIPFNPSCFDEIVGFIPPMPIENGKNFGWEDKNTAVVMANGEFTQTVGGKVEIVRIDFMEAVIAHEIGHSFILGDEYNSCGAQNQCEINPPPKTYLGSPWGGGNCANQCNYDIEEWLGPGTGSKVSSNLDHPFEVVRRGSLPDMLSFMGSGGHQYNFWVTPHIYNHYSMSSLRRILNRPHQDQLAG
jgi:hypothetical protein